MKAVVPIHRLRGSVLGLVGFGRIPQLVAPKAQAFGMKVVAYDPFIPADVFASAGVDRVEFRDAPGDVRLHLGAHSAHARDAAVSSTATRSLNEDGARIW